ncbi:topoisomerase II [Denitrificimonas sp. JX-1]|uniref:Topoisomerase II n=1 Tax=Denitrificimonas halotolerans TaxID=3098930 RepID=A0ABU5GRF6_9GAMM|nr:topoisomerase II [Denitrificimonas sp. JX-1]MDY7219573.1 topoisomerase II [Denitrificimonas sp. JX-1]
MTTGLKLILESADGSHTEAECSRFAVVWQGKEIWVQTVGDGQLLMGVDVEEGDTEYANMVLRPLASNLVGLQLEMEAADVAADDHVHTDECEH